MCHCAASCRYNSDQVLSWDCFVSPLSGDSASARAGAQPASCISSPLALDGSVCTAVKGRRVCRNYWTVSGMLFILTIVHSPSSLAWGIYLGSPFLSRPSLRRRSSSLRISYSHRDSGTTSIHRLLSRVFLATKTVPTIWIFCFAHRQFKLETSKTSCRHCPARGSRAATPSKFITTELHKVSLVHHGGLPQERSSGSVRG